ncbi:hypothetical protein NMA58_31630 (plasmid) [Rhizobium sp. YTUHZ045]|uniref:hypothetical protein n=1 Tax=Rhizobium sp. YTUHZ045 TaxID=2962888 RepID=UPI003DA85ED3
MNFREHGAARQLLFNPRQPDCCRFARGRSATSGTLPDFEAMEPLSNAWQDAQAA